MSRFLQLEARQGVGVRDNIRYFLYSFSMTLLYANDGPVLILDEAYISVKILLRKDSRPLLCKAMDRYYARHWHILIKE